MIKFNADVSSVLAQMNKVMSGGEVGGKKADFANAMKAVEKSISAVDELQQSSDASIKDLLAGRSEDITSVVSAVAKADMSFKLLVGVRNKLIEAYKQTMNMPL
ncbi:MAG TPA: flagellar hook-basal body complex protein FliE [Sedimentisphaerales bacterium]|nr:flagellar hook-basal body complex protein FliE [Sedimentisphaerales bacterium]